MRRRYSGKQAKAYIPPDKRRGKGYKPPPPYRSWLEADVAENLKKRKITFDYETMKIAFVEPAKVRTYIPDLIFGDEDLIVEVKGRWTAQDRRKMGYVIEQNPDLDIRILFDKDNTLSKNSRTRYSDWCRKRNIKCAIGKEVPQEWLDEMNNKGQDDESE